MQHCEHCNKDFYSDTDFDQHQLFVQLTDMTARAVEGNRGLVERVGWISSQLEMGHVLSIMRYDRLSCEDANKRYLDYSDIRNKMLKEYHAKKDLERR